jgi:GMP synthase (glutamine-hydrolysing)
VCVFRGAAANWVGCCKVWMSHGDQISAPPPDFHIIGHTKSAPYAAVAHNTKPLYGIQFHQEVTHSPRGKEVISRFVHDICGCKNDWTMVRIRI